MSNIENVGQFDTLTYPHDCPYVRQLGRYATHVVRFGIVSQTIKTQEAYIEIYHRQGTCPPTHDERNLPTTEWADFVEMGRV